MILRLCINDQKKTYSTSVENWKNVKPSGGARQTGEQVRCGLCLPNMQSLLSKYVLRRASIYTGNLYFFQLAFAEYTLLSLSHVCLDYLPLGTSLQACLSISSVSSVQLFGRVRPFAIPWNAAPQASLSFTISWSFLKLTSIESVMPSNHLILCHSLLLPSIFPSIKVFSSESAFGISWPKYWIFSFSTSPSSECSGLISFRIDWFDLLAV